MDTSKIYYEDKIRDFDKYRRGRTLAQFCRDEGIDYDWMLKAKRKYSGRTRQTQPEEPSDETHNMLSTPAVSDRSGANKTDHRMTGKGMPVEK